MPDESRLLFGACLLFDAASSAEITEGRAFVKMAGGKTVSSGFVNIFEKSATALVLLSIFSGAGVSPRIMSNRFPNSATPLGPS